MASDICDICNQWYVTMLPINGVCRLCEMQEQPWRSAISQELEQLRSRISELTAEQMLTAAIQVARGSDGV